MSRARRTAGTTLIEVLVVIVVFLVGILAIVQVFPRGFQVLLLSRNASVATALSRDEIERMKSRPDQLPEAIVALYPDGSVDVGRSTLDLGPAGTQISENGVLSAGSVERGDYARFSGANTTRHIIGEGRRVPAPRQVGQPGDPNVYGGLMILQFNPVDTLSGTGIRAYGNDLNVRVGNWDSNTERNDYDAFVVNPSSAAHLKVSTTGGVNAVYVVSFSGYVQISGQWRKRDFTNLTLTAPSVATSRDDRGNYPLFDADLQAAIPYPLGAVDPQSIRVRRQFESIGINTAWSTDNVYQFKVLVPELGVLLFHPSAYASYVPRNDGREPLQARVDYDVYDWRVLREEFRFPSGVSAQHRLAVASLKVGGQFGPDGIQLTGIPILEGESAPTALRAAGLNRSDNFVLQDLETGGVFLEKPNGSSPITGTPIISIDKSSGLISVRDTDNNAANGTTVPLLLPDGTILSSVSIDNRAVRALYMVRNEYAVQVLKAPSRYTESDSAPGFAQYAVGTAIGGSPTRIYFPPADANRKVTIGVVNYRIGSGPLRELSGQDFVIRPAQASDPVRLPYVDITEALSFVSATDLPTVAIDRTSRGYGARDVKGASVAVRTLWNPDAFRLSPNAVDNLQVRYNTWARGYRRSTNETYLEQGGFSR